MKTIIHTFIFAFTVFVCSLAQGQTVHLILAIDYFANEISANADYSNMIFAITQGVKGDQLEVVSLDLTKDKQKIIQNIRSIEIGNNDAVLFYYSGHGAMDTNNNNALTYYIGKEVGLERKPDGDAVVTKHTYIAKKSIIDLLRAKNPRIIVLLSDCCSIKAPVPCSPCESVGGFHYAERTLPLYHSLFFESKGLVDINGAQDDFPSLWYEDTNKGSIFTDAFCRCLRQHENERMGWKTFFPFVQKTTENLAATDIKKNKRDLVVDNRVITGQKPKAISLGNGGETSIPNDDEKPIFGVRGLNRNDNNGVTVTQVLPNYPGEKAGLEKGDVILEIDGRSIRNEQDYANAVDAAGKIMNLKVRNVRNGQILNVRVSLQ